MKVELELHADNPGLVVSARYVKEWGSGDTVTYERKFFRDHPNPDIAVRMLMDRVKFDEG